MNRAFAVRVIAALAAALLAASCGGGGSGGTVSQPPPPPVLPALIDFTETGMAVIKVRSNPGGATLLEEKPRSIFEAGPIRRITLLDPDGTVRARYFPPAGFSLIDFAQHTSGEITAALASDSAVTLVRIDHLARVVAELPLLDPEAATDPFYGDNAVRVDDSMVSPFTRDVVRVVRTGQQGDDVIVALRTGRDAVVAYRFQYGQSSGYTRAWRTLVEPGIGMLLVGITSGTFDTFGQLENHFHVHVDADFGGNAAVAVVGKLAAPTFAAHADHFHEPTTIRDGMLVTRLALDGRRTGTTFIETTRETELHGLRMHSGGIALVGRAFTEVRPDGSGWDAYVADVDRTGGTLRFQRHIDVDRGDALFDIDAIDDGRFLAGGTTGYTQNPSGASISGESKALLVVLEADGAVSRRIDVAPAPRENEIRSLARRENELHFTVPRGNDWLVGSWLNGPGTHSGDANPALIAADGAVHQIAVD